ncbi:MAG: fused MFS/spermidine synthase, partial [Verrucomicrobiales bacterium]
MIRRISFLSCLIFISGFCSLVYQVAWIREFRLVFGGTTAAGAAVLAIFMGGLGAGAAFYGRRAGAAANPLRLYGLLEIAVTAAALISPVLLGAARAIYDASGGEMALGVPLATAIRLGLATLVLGPACFFMGGNLPAGITFVAAARDPGRRRLARLYGLNTLGAVAGAALSTFWMLEHLGTRATLYTACGANAVIGIAALLASFAVETGAGANPARSETVAPAASRPFVFAAAFTAGFVFFLLELVWYRMLIPLIGGSVYSLGMILVMALSGIGAGGLLYSLRPADKSVSLRGFAAAAALFALAAALAFAAGDRLVIVAYHAGGLRVFGFTGQILAWSVPAAIVVLGPALLAGYQFPYLVALLGRGREGIGRDTGAAYAWNTCGAIAGALLGGLVLIPELGAIGCWRLAVGLMLALAGAALVFGWERSRTAGAKMPLGAILTMLATSLAISGSGPSAAWRHSPVGFGRVERIPKNVNEFEDWKRQMNRRVRYEIEGRESCIALSATDGFTFIVNGKTDGGAVGDSGTQVMLGLLASLFHPDPESACVIGLGTGTTAGWLAEVPAIQEVDVIELEPGMRRVAREFAPMNRDLLEKPGVRVLTGDAREILPTIERRYDIVISGPSNLSRAGVPNLYTKEFYRSVRERMNDGAIFA